VTTIGGRPGKRSELGLSASTRGKYNEEKETDGTETIKPQGGSTKTIDRVQNHCLVQKKKKLATYERLGISLRQGPLENVQSLAKRRDGIINVVVKA